MKWTITLSLVAGLFWMMPLAAQTPQKPASNWKPNRIFLTAQPLTIGALPYGGLRVGGELTLGPRLAVSNDFTWRFLNPVTNVLDEGERDYTQGVQFQPELRVYFGVNPEAAEAGKRAFRGSLGFRSGYSRYHTEVTNWTFLTDATGQPYEKLVGYTRRQQNFDLSTVWNQKIYFNRTFDGFGMEVYAGLGLRMKRFHYINVSPELDPEQLRREDESRMFSLRRDAVYPLLPLGFRLFYLLP
jgi:hypothetical protein